MHKRLVTVYMLQVLTLWRRTSRHWGLSVNVVEVPEGHNPTFKRFGKLFLLNASTAASFRCVRSWFRLRIKAEARAHSKPEVVKALKHGDVSVPIRNFVEIRLILEDTSIGVGGGLGVSKYKSRH